VKYRRRLFLFCIVFCAGLALSQTKSLSEETSNNTSSCSAAGAPLYCQAGFNGMTDSRGTFNAAPGNVSKEDVHSLLYAGNTSKIFTYYMPWFCMTAGSTATGTGTSCQSHIQVGYTATDANTIRGQMKDIQSRGFDGVVIPYYAKVKDHDQVTMLVRDEIESRGMLFALMEEQGAFEWDRCPRDGKGIDRTQCIADAINADMDYMDTNYFSSLAYLRIDPATMKPSGSGRPYLSFFICEECFINPAPDWAAIWTQVRAHAKMLSQGEPILLFRNPNGFTHLEANGAFAWMGFSSTDPYGVNYSNYFYDQSLKYPAKLPWGSAWKGFDDSAASWSQNRYVGAQCGRTWLQILATSARDYSTSRQLPFLGIVSWNDYEEGTEIETGIDNCLTLSASISGSILSWTPTFSEPSGSEETVSKYVVYEADGDTLTQFGSFSTAVHSFDLSALNLPAGVHTFYVQAVAKASILNKMSAPVTYDTSSSAAPVLTLTPTSMTFASTMVGTTSAAQTATLTNSGDASATISSIAITGDYVKTTNCGSTLSPGTSCTINISFKPSTAGARAGSLTVTDSAAGSPRTISLTGTAVAASTCALPSSAGVNVCSPSNGSSSANPVRTWARGKVTGTFSRMELWIDGTKRFTSSADTIDATFTLAKGSHKFTFRAINTAGTTWTDTVRASVK
jgi:hypothetical protein